MRVSVGGNHAVDAGWAMVAESTCRAQQSTHDVADVRPVENACKQSREVPYRSDSEYGVLLCTCPTYKLPQTRALAYQHALFGDGQRKEYICSGGELLWM